MNLLRRFQYTALRASFRSSSQVARVFPTTGFKNIPISKNVEEELWDWYTPQSFYPVRLGDIIHSKYQVLYKLGYGTTSTLWICRDLHRDEYVCMKSMVCDYPSVEREVKTYEALSDQRTSGLIGRHLVRQALDHFELEIEDRNYNFLIHEPLGLSVELFRTTGKGTLPILYVRILARQMLHALEFIHSANIVHGDLQAKNILLRMADNLVLKDIEENEIKHPSARKVTEQTAVFQIPIYPGPLRRWIGGDSLPILCDFGEARTGEKSYTGLIQPDLFRAPEVFLQIPWGTPVDIWSLGCMVWSLMFPDCLFGRRNSSGKRTDEETGDRNQLARMVSLLGPPPQQLLDNSGARALEFFHEDGSPKEDIPDQTLESFLVSSLKKIGKTMTDRESEMFLAFIRKTVTWTQETRASASELLCDCLGSTMNIWKNRSLSTSDCHVHCYTLLFVVNGK
ncbi:hypothetical protein C0995_005248 [Termitomyces sp. Mi166|nr:hypothetical protein C0995_005248 [Termitomyces sp. Mi166\